MKTLFAVTILAITSSLSYGQYTKTERTSKTIVQQRSIYLNTGFKEFESAQRTLAAIETTHMIRKNQIRNPHASWFDTFKSLAV